MYNVKCVYRVHWMLDPDALQLFLVVRFAVAPPHTNESRETRPDCQFFSSLHQHPGFHVYTFPRQCKETGRVSGRDARDCQGQEGNKVKDTAR